MESIIGSIAKYFGVTPPESASAVIASEVSARTNKLVKQTSKQAVKNPLEATHPVRINGIEFDALIEESRKLEADVPQYSVEDGFSVSDTITLNPETLSMTLFVTHTPVTWYDSHGGNINRTAEICDQLEELFLSRELVTIETSFKTYENMAITSIELKKSADSGYSREIPISFKKVRMTTATTTTIPAEYARAGQTKKTTSGSSGKSGSGSGDDIQSLDDIVAPELAAGQSYLNGEGSIFWNIGDHLGAWDKGEDTYNASSGGGGNTTAALY